MKKFYFLSFSFLAFLILLPISSYAQPVVPPPVPWTMKAGNPAIIQPPTEWQGILNAAAFSPDGATLAVCGGKWGRLEGKPNQGLILLLNPQNGAVRGELRGHNDIVQDIAFSPDGKWLASQSQDGALFIWDVATQRIKYNLSEGKKRDTNDIKEIFLQSRLKIGAWSPDSETLATYESKFDTSLNPPGFASAIKLFRVADGQLTKTFAVRPGFPSAITWTQDGKNLIVFYRIIVKGKTQGSTLEIMDAQSGDTVRKSEFDQENNSSVTAYSADSHLALIQSYQYDPKASKITKSTLQMWDVQAEKEVWSQNALSRTISRATFTRDGKSIVLSNADNEIIFYDALTGALQQTLPGNSCNSLDSIAVSPDKKRIAFLEQAGSAVYLWNLEVPLPKPRFASQIVLREIFNSRAFQWQNNTLVLASGEEDWNDKDDLRTGKEVHIQTWNGATGETKEQIIPEKHIISQGALSPDGNLLAVEVGNQPKPGFFDVEGVGIYDLKEAKLLRLLPEKYGISSMVWSPDGKTLATNLYDSDIKIWDVATGTLQRTIKTEVQAIDWSPDGKIIVAGSEDGSVQFFSGKPNEIKDDDLPLDQQINGNVGFVSFSPDGKTLAVGITENPDTKTQKSSLHLLDVAIGKEKRVLPTQKFLREIHWTPDGTSIGAISIPDVNYARDGQLRVWDATTGADLIAIDERCGLEDFAFSPDGRQLATHSWNRVRVWKIK